LTVSNEFRMGRGQFQYGAGGNTVTGTPAGLRVCVGSAAARASVFDVGDTYYIGSVCRFGSGVADFKAYVGNVTVGRSWGGNHHTLSVVDLRDTTNLVFDVEETVSIGGAASSSGYVYLFGGAAGGRACASNLYISTPWADGALLVLSNVQFAVSNEVAINSPGWLTNYVNGVASGIDLQSTNLSISAAGGMHLRFLQDPPGQALACWGLRLKGDARAQLNALTTTPAKVTYDISGLSPKYQQKFGVHYDARRDRTLLGIPAVLQGTILAIR
jgi:hypothetical protein